jgi:hypothetical protein
VCDVALEALHFFPPRLDDWRPCFLNSGTMKMSDGKKMDCYLRGISTDKVVPSNSSWLKRSDKRTDAVRPMGDAFAESEKKSTDARR